MAPEMIVELRADHRSDLFSLGAVLFEMLTLRRLFTGRSTSEILEQVVAGQSPSPRTFNPAVPDEVMEILRRALRRDPAHRFTSAGQMGEACEHFLYDKGYGPTNLTLKQQLGLLFPEDQAAAAEPAAPSYFPVVHTAMIPINEGLGSPRSHDQDDVATAVAMPREGIPEAPDLTIETIAPDPPKSS